MTDLSVHIPTCISTKYTYCSSGPLRPYLPTRVLYLWTTGVRSFVDSLKEKLLLLLLLLHSSLLLFCTIAAVSLLPSYLLIIIIFITLFFHSLARTYKHYNFDGAEPAVEVSILYCLMVSTAGGKLEPSSRWIVQYGAVCRADEAFPFVIHQVQNIFCCIAYIYCINESREHAA